MKLQAREVEALKAEVNLLRRKGGHVYVPPQPPSGAPSGSGMLDDGGYGVPQPPPM